MIFVFVWVKEKRRERGMEKEQEGRE